MERIELSEEPQVDASTSEPSLRGRIGRGLRWSLTGLLATKMASFLISLVIARLLTVHEFGVWGLALSVTAFLMVVNDAGVIARSFSGPVASRTWRRLRPGWRSPSALCAMRPCS